MNHPLPISDVFHEKAKCRWCGRAFVQIYGYFWVCPAPACAERCIASAVWKRENMRIDGDMPFLFLPLPFQVEYEDSPFRRLLVHGQAGVSKSYGGRWLAYKWALRYPGQMTLLLRVTLDQLRKNHLVYAENEVDTLGPEKGDARYTKTPDNVIRFKSTGSYVYMGYCDSTGDIGQHLGAEWDLIIFEQGEQFLPEAINTISTRDRGSATGRQALIREAKRDSGRTIVLVNAGGRAAAFLDDHYLKRDPDRKKYPHYQPVYYGAIEGTIEDNPYLPPDYLEATLGGLDRIRHAQLAQNRRDIFEGQFFPEFNAATHVQRIEPT